MQTQAGNLEVFFRKRINGVWGAPENISQTAGTSEWPTITVDGATGKAYVAWHDNNAGSWDILFREFDGTKWLDIQNLTKTGSASARPDIFCDNGGGIHLVYLERHGNWRVKYMMKEGVYDFPIYSPLNLELKTHYNATTSTKTNSLKWEENPENVKHSEFQYVLYRKEHGQADSQYTSIAMIPHTTLSYKDKGLPTDKKYLYRMKCLSSWDEESEGTSNTVSEKWIWPALDPLLKTEYNKFLFYREKINSLSWSSNPLNNAITVDNYEIYRKLVSQSDSEYTLVSSVGADVNYYQDRSLAIDETHSYYVVVVDAEGVRSNPSVVVMEEQTSSLN
jgi:hypothetical protein